jgi:hypothetical protein
MAYMTYAPIPKWKNIINALIKPFSLEKKFNKNWVSKNERSFWFSRSSWSIYVIIKFRLTVNNNAQVNVWLPDYFCNEATAAIRSLNVKLSFYPILSDGRPNLKVCSQMLNDCVPDIILFVNYFGESIFSKQLSNIALKTNAWFVEDSAHCLFPENGIGKYGDFVIYSPHKFLAIPDGAVLVINTHGPSKLNDCLLDKFDFTALYNSIINSPKKSNFFSLKWLFKRVIQKSGFHLFFKINNFETIGSLTNINNLPHPKMSWLAQKLLSNPLDLKNESLYRKKIQKKWKDSIEKSKFFDGENINIDNISHTPYMAKIFTNLESKKIFDLLQKSKIPVSLWPDLPPEVINEPNVHKVAIEMSKSYIFLPVHSSIHKKKLTLKIRNL